MQKEQLKPILINTAVAVGVVVALLFGYSYFFGKSDTEEEKNAVDGLTAETVTKVAETISILSKLDTEVTKSVEFFGIEAFRSLMDFSVEIPAVGKQDVGRPDPFVPTDWKIENMNIVGGAINQADLLGDFPENMSQ